MDLNKVNLIGNLTQDPELKNLPSGQGLTAFNLATNYIWYDAKSKEKKTRADFHKIVAWGHLADIITTYLKKGSKVYVEGRLQNRTWDDKEGKKHYLTEIIASDLIMLGGSKKESSGDETAKEDIEVEEIQIENN
ncbi:single-stranded DNA-binding protein [Patescibacteria group bacterium]|jgi:single-strand DNA-binding protein|nr:single-stranded DNA-binding protein [Patescibacteria group bacterium]